MTFFDETKSIIENIALLSAPLVLFISIIGLRQLQIAKNSLKITSARDAAKLSFEITKEYDEKFNQAYYNLAKAMQKNGIPEFEGIITDFTITEYNKLDKNLRDKWEKNYSKIEIEFIHLTNLLECYSISFVKKIADEDIAFNIDCYLFLQLTELGYPYIIKKHNEDKINLSCLNTIQLYKIWKSRIIAMHNEQEFKNLQEKIRTAGVMEPLKPIGA
jgi:hypothetical protein